MRTLRVPELAASDAFLCVRLAAINFLLNLSIETSAVFLPLYAIGMGASELQVGFIVASYGVSFFVSSLVFGRQSDIHGRVAFVRLGLGLSALAYGLQIVATNPLTLLVARAFVGLCLGIRSEAMTAYVYDAGGRMGRFISYGSLGWLFGAITAAILRDYHILFVASGLASALAFVFSLTLEELAVSRVRVALLPVSLLRSNIRVYLSFFIRQMGAQAVWAVFPLFLAGIGASRTWIAVLSAINMGGQFLAMRFVDRFDPARMVVLGLALSVVVFAAYGFSTNYLQLAPVQVLLSIAWSCLFIGSLTFLLRKNVERGSAAGLLYSATNLSTGLGPVMGGAISQAWGFSALMFVASGLALTGLLASRGLRE